MTKPSVEEQLAALRRKRTLLQRNMQRTLNRAVADTAMDAASAECHLALLESHFRQLCQVQQQIEEIDLEEDSRDQFEADFIATKSTLLKRVLGRCGLIDEIVEAPRSNGTHKNTGGILGFLRDVRRCLLDHFEIRTA